MYLNINFKIMNRSDLEPCHTIGSDISEKGMYKSSYNIRFSAVTGILVKIVADLCPYVIISLW